MVESQVILNLFTLFTYHFYLVGFYIHNISWLLQDATTRYVDNSHIFYNILLVYWVDVCSFATEFLIKLKV